MRAPEKIATSEGAIIPATMWRARLELADSLSDAADKHPLWCCVYGPVFPSAVHQDHALDQCERKSGDDQIHHSGAIFID
jgi:hypothetical protein